MQIQRIQTLYLLLSAIVMIVFCFLPFGSLQLNVDEGDMMQTAYYELTPLTFIPVLIPAATGALLLLIDMFLYNNFARQKTVLIFAMMMILVTIGLVIYICCDHATQGTLHWGLSGLLLVVSLVLAVSAMTRIRHDEHLLRSSNRLF